LLLRKFESKFIETIIAKDKPAAKRSYETWEKLAKRLSQLGLSSEDIARVWFEFQLGKDTQSFLIP
jgi:hypothetical protein